MLSRSSIRLIVLLGGLGSLLGLPTDDIPKRYSFKDLSRSPLQFREEPSQVSAFGAFLIVNFYGGAIRAFDSTSFQETWSFNAQDNVVYEPVLHQDTLYFGSDDGHLYQLSLKTGKLLRKINLGGAIRAKPSFHSGKIIVPVLSPERAVVALEDKTAKLLWKIQEKEGGGFANEVLIHQDEIVFASRSGRFYVVDANSGKIRISKLLSKAHQQEVIAKPLVSDDVYFIISADRMKKEKSWPGERTLYALDSRNGDLLWELNLGRDVRANGAIQNGKLFIRSSGKMETSDDDAVLLAVNLNDRKVLWRYRSHAIGFGVDVVHNQNTIFSTWNDGKVTAHAGESGKLIWEVTGLQANYVSKPIIHNDRFYFVYYTTASNVGGLAEMRVPPL